MTNTLISAARTKAQAAETAYTELLDKVEARSKELAEKGGDATSVLANYRSELDKAERQYKEARKQLKKAKQLSEARSNTSKLLPKGERISIGSEATTYRQGDPDSPSYFSDLYWSLRGSEGATERLQRGTREALVLAEERGKPLRDAEGRAMSSSSGAGGDFLPPLYFGDLYARYRRPRRVTSNLVRNLPLAAKGNTITVPRITGGSLTGAQQDNQNVTNQDPTTAMISIPVCTIAGYVDLSRQIIERSQPGMDQLIMEDLIADYNKRLNTYVLSGSGSGGQPKGILSTSYNSITFTSGSPTVPLLYPKLLDAMRQVEENIFDYASAWVMTARRWAWILDYVDSTGRPLVVPEAQGPYNQIGVLSSGDAGPFGNADDMIRPAGTLVGLPVYIDEMLPKTQGAGTNQDVIMCACFDEHILWEDPQGPRQFRFEGVTSQTAAIRVQCFGYHGFTAERYSVATSVISGTGLVAPSF